MRILVTGGAGYIGSHTVRHLLDRGHQVTVLDNLSEGHRAAVPAECLHVGDLKDIDFVDHLLLVHRIDAVVHFAACASVAESVADPAKYYRNNLVHGLMLLDLVRRHGIRKFVFSSSCATYGVPQQIPITESEPQKPINPYGRTKLAFECALADYAQAYGIGAVALRYFNAAGAAADGSIGEDHHPETHLIPLVLKVALGQRPRIDIFGTDYPTADGTCIRDYIHVEDLAVAHSLALEKITPGDWQAYNVGIGHGASVREVIRIAEEITGKTIPFQECPRRPGDPPILIADAQKIRQELGWQPRFPTLHAMIETAWHWHRQHPDGYPK
jgi:UDP-glucose 4-epimerase